MNAYQIEARVQAIEGEDERATALKVLGYVLATWHANSEEAIRFHLSIIEVLFRWFPAGESVRRLILTPYFESYWLHAARNRRFSFRAPDVTVAGIETASITSEADRIRAVLSAAANGLNIRGAQEVLQRLRAQST
jgi:hypothetical protein